MNQDAKRISLTMEQFDDALKKWKSKGTERAFWAYLIGTLPLAGAAPFISGVSPDKAIIGCVLYYGFILMLVVLIR